MKLLLVPILMLLTLPGLAQNPSPSPAASSPAKKIGMFVYPKNSQNTDQQLKDENECYSSAKQGTGFDPETPLPSGQSAQEKEAAQKEAAQQAAAATPKGGAVKGAAVGAAGGAAIGAIAADDAGTGAAVGATAGAVRGRRKQKKAQKAAGQQAAQQTAQAQQQSEAEAKAQYQGKQDTFKRAFSACMDARSYSVK